jgi:hypothetical protein
LAVDVTGAIVRARTEFFAEKHVLHANSGERPLQRVAIELRRERLAGTDLTSAMAVTWCVVTRCRK